MELTQIRLIVTDFPAMFRYYRDVLGLPPQPGASEAGPYAAFKPAGGGTLALHARADLARQLAGVLRDGAPGGDAALVALRVDALEDHLAAATARGARPLGGIVDFGRLRCAYLRDPEQNLLELQQWQAG